MPVISALKHIVGTSKSTGVNWVAYWATLVSATVENAAPTHVVLTFPAAKPILGATDFTIAGFTIASGSWTGAVLTLVLSTALVQYDGDLTITFVTTGGTATVTNNVNDSQTIAWFDFEDASTLTVDGSNYVSAWRDKLASGVNFAQATAGVQPLLTVDGVDCYPNTTARWMRTANNIISDATYPHTLYILMKSKVVGAYNHFFDSYSTNQRSIMFDGANIKAYGGSAWFGTQAKPANNTWFILTVQWNGANSFIRKENADPVTGSGGTSSLVGLTINTNGGNTTYAQSVFKEIIVRGVADGADTYNAIYAYLLKKK